jgi:hypothetical protein
MSEVKSLVEVAFAPQFRAQGRLAEQPRLLALNLARQRDLDSAYHDSLCLAAGPRGMRPCGKTPRISLFFDGTGTGNNLNNDLCLNKIIRYVEQGDALPPQRGEHFRSPTRSPGRGRAQAISVAMRFTLMIWPLQIIS